MKKWQLILPLLISFMLIMFQTTLVSAEDNVISSPRPKIGLVLGGGSAGGFAHIGVLKWLEEHHIPIDYLAGTSMGGLMGGCYAMGMSPSEITALVYSIDWDELFNPNPPYSALYFRRKEDLKNFPIFEIGYRNEKVQLPSGLGIYRIDLVLSRITDTYPSDINFDQLPTPFQCVATDIQNFEPIVFEKGSLKEALRATMAIPGVFNPVEQNGEVLVDGGILNNVPVEVVKNMGANVVIAVNIAAPVEYRDAESIDSVLGKTIDAVLAANTSRSLSLADVVLAPSFDGLGLVQWDAAKRYMELGYQAAEDAADSLQKYALSAPEWQNYLSERQKNRQQKNFTPTAIEIQGASEFNAGIIQKQLASHIGKPLNSAFLENDLNQIMGSGLFESLSYEFKIESEQTVLLIIAKEKSYGPPFIRFSVNSETSGLSSDNYELNLGMRLTSFNTAGQGSEIRVDLDLGTEAALKMELFKPILKNDFFIAPSLFITSNNYSCFVSDDRVTDYRRIDSGQRLNLGYSPDKNSELRLGYVTGQQTINTKVGDVLPESLTGSFKYAEFKWAYRSGNQLAFPGKNLSIDLTANRYFAAPGADTEFNLAEAKLRWNNSYLSNDSLLVLLAAGTSREELPLPQQFKLGGPFRLSAYSFDQFAEDNYVLGTIGYLKLIPRWSKLKKVYAVCWVESGATFDSWSNPDLISDLSLGLFTSTLFGPLTVGYSIGDDSNQTLFMVLGHVF